MIIVNPEQDKAPHPLQARSLHFFCAEITPSTPTPAPTRTPPPPGRAGTSCVPSPDPARGAPAEWTFFSVRYIADDPLSSLQRPGLISPAR